MRQTSRKSMTFPSIIVSILFIGIIIVFTCVTVFRNWLNTQKPTSSLSVSSNPIKQVYITNPANGSAQQVVKSAFISKCEGIYDGKIDLVRLKNGICTLVYSFINNDQTVIYNIAQTKKVIFIGVGYNRLDRASTVSVLNIDSGNLKMLYDHTKSPKQTYPGEFTDNSINSFTIIGDSLYVSIGGNYASKGSLYNVPVSNPETLTKLGDYTGGADITQLGKYYVIHNGYGDTSWTDNYSLLNPMTKSIEQFLVSGSYNLPGEIKLGEDGSSNFLLAAVQKSGYQSGIPNELPLYSAISFMPLSNLSKRIALLPSYYMPENIADIKYVPQQQKIYLTGTSLYMFDISTKTLSKIADLSTNSLIRYRISSITSTTMCLEQWGVYIDESKKMSTDMIQKTVSGFPSSFLVDLSKKSVTVNTTHNTCSSLITPTRTLQKTITGIDIFKQLNLPTDYAIYSSSRSLQKCDVV